MELPKIFIWKGSGNSLQSQWTNPGVAYMGATGRNASIAGLNPNSVLGHIIENRAFLLPDGKPITGEISWQLEGSTVIAQEAALENGNSGTRVMMLDPKYHTAVITQTSNTYETEMDALIFTSGDAGEFWQIEHLDGTRGSIFRIGEYASGKDLPIGDTDVRWQEQNFADFNKACLARTYRAAGYGPGIYYLVVVPGARNEEVSVEEGTKVEVQNAFIRGLQPFVIWRNKTERYEIRTIMVMPAIPQTFGSHYSFDSDLLGRSLHPDVSQWNWFDIGFYDGHNVTVKRVGKSVRVSGVKVTGGMANVVREMGAYLRRPKNFPHMAPPNYAQALDMMRSGEVKIAGMPLEDEEEVGRGRRLIQEYKDKEGGKLIQSMIQNHLEIDSVFAFTGGGVSDLLEQIQAKTVHRPKQLTKILHPDISRIANVAGIFWLLNLAYRRQSVLR